jgi:hypothetical protein
MQIIQEDAGRRLVVAETTPRLPLTVFLAGVALVVLVAAPWRWLWSILRGIDAGPPDLVSSGVWLLIGLLVLSSLLRGKRLERLAVDRDVGRIDWRFSHFAGFPGLQRHVDLEDLEALEVKLMPTSRGVVEREAKGGVRSRITLKAGHGRTTPLDVRIASVDRVEMLADFGLRLGSAAGLVHYRVLGNDPNQFAIELVRSAGSDVQTVPDVSAAADSAGGAPGAAALDAARTDRLPAFDPHTFEGSPRVAVWAPGREVRFEKRWSAPILLTPLLLAGLTGPLAWLRLPSLQTMPLPPRIAALVLITFSGLAIAAIGWVGLTSGLPRRAVFDWASGTLVVRGVREGRTIPFSEISAIEQFTRAYRGRTGYRQYYMSYCCEIRAIARTNESPGAPLLLTETRSYREDFTTPALMASPLSTELSSALGVERRTSKGGDVTREAFAPPLP